MKTGSSVFTNKFFRMAIALVFIASLTLIGGCSSSPSPTSSPVSQQQTTQNPATNPNAPATPTSSIPIIGKVQTPSQAAISGTDFVDAVSQVMDALVVIEVTYGPGGLPGQPGVTGGAGTGWIIDSSGVIVTNDHVVSDAQTITVTLSNNKQYKPTSVKTDPAHDLAVLKIVAPNLTAVTLGDSSTLSLAQPLAALGNSLDMGIRVTSGLVSRLGTSASYSIPSQPDVNFTNLIETDAIINPGNSGGILINLSGAVVGIVNAGLSGPNTDTVGFGYAIPINDALPIISNLAASL
jgi:serine protease Do